MIQRIQSIYLLLVGISAGLMLFLPVAVSNGGMISGLGYTPFAVLCGWLVVHSIGSIFQFKNRKLQMRLVWALLIIAAIVTGKLNQ